jgi:uncharacterized repeat protein (TIGR03803 family)
LFTRLGGVWACLGAASKQSRVLSALIAGFVLISAGPVAAQTFTPLHSFTAGSPITNSDGGNPVAGLVLSGGTNFTTLYSFTNGSDGAYPFDGLILSGSTLYGTANAGGSTGFGTVFAVSTNGTNFTTLHSFTNGSDGADPYAGLMLSGNTLYGTAGLGGSSSHGTVFAVNTNGTNFTTLYSFTNGSDGALPAGGLILSGDTFYGTATSGRSVDNGTVSSNGTVFSLSFAPQLAISLSGTNVILTWPTNVDGFDYSGFTLQSTTNLSPAPWCTVTNLPVVVDEQFTVTKPTCGTQRFYELSQ